MQNDKLLDDDFMQAKQDGPETREFFITPENVNKALIKARLTTAILSTIVIVVVVGAQWHKLRSAKDLYIIFLFPVVLIGITLVVSAKRTRSLLESFRVIINKEGIIRQQKGTQEYTIPKTEITGIIKNNRGFSVTGTSRLNRIDIPFIVNDPHLIQPLLEELHPITEEKSNPVKFQVLMWGPTALIIILTYIIYTADNKWLFAGASLVLAGCLLTCLVIIQKAQSPPRYVKLISWMIIFPLLSLLWGVLYKFTGHAPF